MAGKDVYVEKPCSHNVFEGRLLVSRGTCFKRRGSIGFKEPGDPPQGLDFDIWLGPAPKQPYHGNLVFDAGASVEPVEIKTVPGVKSPAAPRGPGGGIFGNFIECMRTRRSEDRDAHILEAHYSAALCHLANISYRLGEEVPFDGKRKAFGDNKAAGEAFEQMQDHLKDNSVALHETTYRLGRKPMIDVENEKFIGDPEADKLLTREYREPFVVPKIG